MNQTPSDLRKPLFIDDAVRRITEDGRERLKEVAPELVGNFKGLVYDKTRDMVLPLVRLAKNAKEARVFRELWGYAQGSYLKLQREYNILY